MFCVDELSVSIFETLRFGLFSVNVPVLVYYSHLTAIVVSLLLSFFLLFHNRHSLAAQILATISALFSLWSASDILLWTQIDSSIIMFIWSYWFSFFISIFVLSFYFLYAFIKKTDVKTVWKVVFSCIILSVLLLSTTSHTLTGFDVPGCSAIENPLMIDVIYALTLLILVCICLFGLKEYRKEQDKTAKKQILLATSGVALFLLSFSVATYVASIANIFSAEPDTFAIEQYGYFGMTIFIGFLAYTIVQYKAFNVKLLATQALVFTLTILIGSQFFFIRNPTNIVLNGITLVLAIGFGFLLTRSVKREVEAKELIQIQKDSLEKANTRLKELDVQKTEFISFATHQLRSPLTSIKGNTSLILEGDLGVVSDPVKDVVQTIFTSIKTMVNIVDDYLNVSRIELGTMKYTLVDMDFKELFHDVMNEQKVNIEAKGLTYSVSVDEGQTYKIKADPDKFKQVVMNTIDNSIKYTPQGSLTISLSKDPTRKIIRLKIADTGVGIKAEVMPKLFRKFSRAPDASAANIHGTGLGLFIAKEIMNAHGGKIWAESEGEGKGSQFYVEMPEA